MTGNGSSLTSSCQIDSRDNNQMKDWKRLPNENVRTNCYHRMLLQIFSSRSLSKVTACTECVSLIKALSHISNSTQWPFGHCVDRMLLQIRARSAAFCVFIFCSLIILSINLLEKLLILLFCML